MLEEYFAVNKTKMDAERITKFEKYRKEMFEEGNDKKYKTYMEMSKVKDITK